MDEIAILMINYKSPVYTINCLKSLDSVRNEGEAFTVWLLDNASGDESAGRIARAISEHGWDGWVNFTAGTENLGFAGGNNALLKQVLAEKEVPPYLLLLNNDTLVHAGCFQHSVQVLKNDPKIGVMSCRLLNGDGSLQSVARKLPSPLRETLRAFGLPYMWPSLFDWADLEYRGWDQEREARDVEWVGGAFMLMHMETARQTGLFDTDFFFYGEDMELCSRIGRSGLRVHYNPVVTITHFGGGSSDATRLQNRRKDILRWRARFLVQRKCYGALAAAWSRGMYISAFYLHKLWLQLRGRTDTDSWRGVVAGLDELLHLYKDDV